MPIQANLLRLKNPIKMSMDVGQFLVIGLVTFLLTNTIYLPHIHSYYLLLRIIFSCRCRFWFFSYIDEEG
jgi:hypothetical protein